MYRSKYAVFVKNFSSKIARKPSIYAGFQFFRFAQIKPRSIQKYDTTKVLIWDELLFLFFVSITLFVEIMSRISNCFLISN